MTRALFTIDVEAELRKVCRRRWPSAGERVAEVVRFFELFGPSGICVNVLRRRVSVQVRVSKVPMRAWELADILSDGEAPAQERHRALTELEARDWLGPVALAGEPAWSRTGGVPGEPLTLTLGRPPARGELEVLTRVCAFSRSPIWIGGRAQPDHRDRMFGSRDIAVAGWKGTVGLPREGELCRTVWVHGGVVVRDESAWSPRGWAHLAVLHWEGQGAPTPTQIDSTREAIVRVRSSILSRVAAGLDALTSPLRRQAVLLLMNRAECTQDPGPFRDAKIFTRAVGDPASIPEVRSLATGSRLWATTDRSHRDRWDVSPDRVLVLDDRQRRFVSGVLGLIPVEPPCSAPRGWWSRLSPRHGFEVLRRHWKGLWARLTPGHGRPLGPGELTPLERRFADELTALLGRGLYRLPGLGTGAGGSLGVRFVDSGRFAARVDLGGTSSRLLLGRRHLVVGQATRAVAADPRALYPALALLFDGHDGFGRAKRSLQSRLLGDQITGGV